MALAVGANEFTADELFEISQYEKIVIFQNTVLQGNHPTIDIPGGECKPMKEDRVKIFSGEGKVSPPELQVDYSIDYYKALSLQVTASPLLINSVYCALRDETRIKTAEEWDGIKKAYQVLSDENLRRKYDEGRLTFEESMPIPRSTLKVRSQNQRSSAKSLVRADVVAPSVARRSSSSLRKESISQIRPEKSIPTGPRAERIEAAPRAMFNPKFTLPSRSGPPRFAPTGPKVFSNASKPLPQSPTQKLPPQKESNEERYDKVEMDFDRNYYKVLGVQNMDSVKTSSILAAFNKKKKTMLYPAKGSKKEWSLEDWEDAQEAFRILSDKKLRQIYNEGRAARLQVADRKSLDIPDAKTVAKIQAAQLPSSDRLDDIRPKLIVGKFAAKTSSSKNAKLDNDPNPARRKSLPTRTTRARSAEGNLQGSGSKEPRIQHLSNGDIIINGTLFKHTTKKRAKDKKKCDREAETGGLKRKRETQQSDGRNAGDSGVHKRKKR